MGRLLLILIALVPISVGCGFLSGSKRVPAPKWNANAAADNAMEQFDSDGDGFLAGKELDATPGLKAALREIDTDGDKKLSREEIYERINTYVGTKVGLMEFRCNIIYKGRPLQNATVRFVPEPFIAGVVGSAIGETRPDGQATMGLEDSVEPYMQPGIYRVEVTSDTQNIPAKYNTETTLGVEAAPVTTQDQEGAVTFNLR